MLLNITVEEEVDLGTAQDPCLHGEEGWDRDFAGLIIYQPGDVGVGGVGITGGWGLIILWSSAPQVR